jgi:hypothetical protein
MKQWLIGLAVLAVLLAGCARAPPAAAPAAAQAVPTATETAVSGFDGDISEVDSLNSDLDTSEFDSLDQDLAGLE